MRICFRREIIQTGSLKMAFGCQMILAYSYISIMFLLIYGMMWLFDVRLDTRFFCHCFLYIGIYANIGYVLFCICYTRFGSLFISSETNQS